MAKKDSDSQLFAFLGIFLTVIGFLIVLLSRKEDKYAMFYAKQGLVLFFAWLAVWLVGMVLGWIPVVGWLIHWVLLVLVFIAWVLGIVYSFSGQQKDIPIIGSFAQKLNV